MPHVSACSLYPQAAAGENQHRHQHCTPLPVASCRWLPPSRLPAPGVHKYAAVHHPKPPHLPPAPHLPSAAALPCRSGDALGDRSSPATLRYFVERGRERESANRRPRPLVLGVCPVNDWRPCRRRRRGRGAGSGLVLPDVPIVVPVAGEVAAWSHRRVYQGRYACTYTYAYILINLSELEY